jgi:hypothetical protein
MGKEKENPFLKHKTLDDAFDYMEKDSSKDLDSAFKAYNEFNKKDNENHYFNNIMYPAMDEMYKAFSETLKKSFKNDTDKVTKKSAELKKAAVAGLKKFFARASPAILSMDEVKNMKDDEKLYEILVHHYDRITGRDMQQEEGKHKVPGLAEIIESLARDEKATVGHALRGIYEIKQAHASKAYAKLNNTFFGVHFGKYANAPQKVGAYVKKIMKERNHNISDPVKFWKNDLHDYINIRNGVVEGKWVEGTDTHEQYGIKSNDPNKKE